MKKIINILICFTLLFSLFIVSASAQSYEVSFSEDFSSFICNKNKYTPIDNENLSIDTIDKESIIIELDDEQKKTVSELEILIDKDNLFITAEYKLKNNVRVLVTYINDKYRELYNNAISGKDEQLRINFSYPDENNLNVQKSLLKGKKVTKQIKPYDFYDNFEVFSEFIPQKASLSVGQLVFINEKCYYIEFNDAGIKNNNDFWDIYENGGKINLYEISDNDTLRNIEECYYKFKGDLEIFNDSDFANSFSKVLSLIIFGILPLAVLIVSIVLGIRFKEKYRKLFFSLGGIAFTEILIFIAILVLFNIK